MALITCPECGKEVSDKAVACPNCATPISKLYDSDTVSEEVDEALERMYLSQVSYMYSGEFPELKNNVIVATGIPQTTIESADPKRATSQPGVFLANLFEREYGAFKAINNGERRYAELVLRAIQVASRKKYFTKRYGIWVADGGCALVYAIEAIVFSSLSEDDILEMANILFASIPNESPCRGAIYDRIRKALPSKCEEELLTACNLKSASSAHNAPYFEWAFKDWKKLRLNGEEFDFFKYQRRTRKKEKKKPEKEKENSKTRPSVDLDKSFIEQLMRSGAISNGKAPAVCPSCKSIHGWKKVASGNKGFSVGKAAVGVVVAGPVGAVGGALGKKTDTYRCQDCGFEHDYPNDPANKDGSEVYRHQLEFEHAKQTTRNNGQESLSSNGRSCLNAIVVLFIVVLLFFFLASVASCMK